MSTIRFQVKQYTVCLNPNIPCPGSQRVNASGFIECTDNTNKLIMYFIDEGQALPTPYLTPARNGVMFVPSRDMTKYVDILRNESPVWANMEDSKPARFYMATGWEPVGESE